MDPALFRRFQQLAYEHAGIHLKPGKEALVSARILKRLRALGLATPREYLRYLRGDGSGEEIVQFLDVISTNFTSFFRERDHFDLLEARVRETLEQGRDRLRLWSAAASSGEEAYSMAISVERVRGGQRLDYRILGTDISTGALSRAYTGQYPARAMEPLSRWEQDRFFRRRTVGQRCCWEILPALRERMLFRRLNLAAPPYPLLGPLDVIFCRNVMIYFDGRVRQRLVAELERLLRPGGLLCTGHAESLHGLRTGLRMIQPSVYTKVSGAHA